MTRAITAAAKRATQKNTVRPVHLVRLDFDDAVVSLTDAPFNVVYDGIIFVGVGSLGRISPVDEDAEFTPHGVKIDLSGIPPEMLALGLSGHIQGRQALIHVAFLDVAHQIIYAPVEVFRGRMDAMDFHIGETATISLYAESRLTDWYRPRVRRYNHQDQQDLYPGDLGLEFVEEMVDREIFWGRS